MKQTFTEALESKRSEFGVELTDEATERLARYFELVQASSPLLHLVAPCSPEEFAVRHILESLALLEFLPENARIADVGAGAGLPSLPCLIVRGDLSGILIESKEKKAEFLQGAIEQLGLAGRATILNRQFSEVREIDVDFVTCRALDKFTDLLPRLIKWSKKRRLLLFGGPNLGEALIKNKIAFSEKLMPLSERRYLFVMNSP